MGTKTPTRTVLVGFAEHYIVSYRGRLRTYAQVAHSQIKSNEFKSIQSNHFILLNGLLSFLQCNSVATMSPDPVYSHARHVLPLLAHSSTNVPYYGQTPTHVCETKAAQAKQVIPLPSNKSDQAWSFLFGFNVLVFIYVLRS